jgi:NADH-quinone oxidoreductase subunit L
VLGVGTIVAAAPYFMGNTSTHYTLDAGHQGGIISGGWVAEMVHDSHAAGGVPVPHVAGSDHHPTIFGADPHTAMYWISGIVGTIGLLLAVWIHLLRRSTADAWRAALLSRRSTRWLPRAMEHKWYVDEIYIALIRTPLWVTGHLLTLVDRYLIDGLIVDGVARLPRAVARWFQPLQSGAVQGYAVTMAGGAALIGLLILFAPEIISFVQGLGSGGAG